MSSIEAWIDAHPLLTVAIAIAIFAGLAFVDSRPAVRFLLFFGHTPAKTSQEQVGKKLAEWNRMVRGLAGSAALFEFAEARRDLREAIKLAQHYGYNVSKWLPTLERLR